VEYLFQSLEGKLGSVLLTREFIILDRPKLVAVIPVRSVDYVGYPKEWTETSNVQVIAQGNDHSLYMSATEAKEFVDFLLGLIAPPS